MKVLTTKIIEDAVKYLRNQHVKPFSDGNYYFITPPMPTKAYRKGYLVGYSKRRAFMKNEMALLRGELKRLKAANSHLLDYVRELEQKLATFEASNQREQRYNAAMEIIKKTIEALQ